MDSNRPLSGCPGNRKSFEPAGSVMKKAQLLGFQANTRNSSAFSSDFMQSTKERFTYELNKDDNNWMLKCYKGVEENGYSTNTVVSVEQRRGTNILIIGCGPGGSILTFIEFDTKKQADEWEKLICMIVGKEYNPPLGIRRVQTEIESRREKKKLTKQTSAPPGFLLKKKEVKTNNELAGRVKHTTSRQIKETSPIVELVSTESSSSSSSPPPPPPSSSSSSSPPPPPPSSSSSPPSPPPSSSSPPPPPPSSSSSPPPPPPSSSSPPPPPPSSSSSSPPPPPSPPPSSSLSSSSSPPPSPSSPSLSLHSTLSQSNSTDFSLLSQPSSLSSLLDSRQWYSPLIDSDITEGRYMRKDLMGTVLVDLNGNVCVKSTKPGSRLHDGDKILAIDAKQRMNARKMAKYIQRNDSEKFSLRINHGVRCAISKHVQGFHINVKSNEMIKIDVEDVMKTIRHLPCTISGNQSSTLAVTDDVNFTEETEFRQNTVDDKEIPLETFTIIHLQPDCLLQALSQLDGSVIGEEKGQESLNEVMSETDRSSSDDNLVATPAMSHDSRRNHRDEASDQPEKSPADDHADRQSPSSEEYKGVTLRNHGNTSPSKDRHRREGRVFNYED
nr:tripartite motif-containing protein 66-like [Lytechinus pictus]